MFHLNFFCAYVGGEGVRRKKLVHRSSELLRSYKNMRPSDCVLLRRLCCFIANN